MNYFYLNDQSDVSYAGSVLPSSGCIGHHHHLSPSSGPADGRPYVKYLNILATYPRAIKYLKEEERIRNLNELNVATQVTTYAHSVHVAMSPRS